MNSNLSLALIVIVGLVASSNALPARKRMVYYQQPAQYYANPQRLMYMQYVQPSYTNGRSAQAASALVSGETVATGTYLRGDFDASAGPAVSVASSQEQQDEDVLAAAGAHGAHSVAEAYPEETVVSQQAEVDFDSDSNTGIQATITKNDDESKVPREYNFESSDVSGTIGINVGAPGGFVAGGSAESETPGAPGAPTAPAGVDFTASLPAPAPIAPVATVAPAPGNRYLPAKKKVYVELQQSAEEDADVDETEAENAVAVVDDDEATDEDEETDVAPLPVVPKHPARSPSGRRPAAKKPVKPIKASSNCAGGCTKAAKPLPAGTFFPIDFGGTAGGAIAIANSLSTAEGGSATSHAIAYGSPDAARARVRPARRH